MRRCGDTPERSSVRAFWRSGVLAFRRSGARWVLREFSIPEGSVILMLSFLLSAALGVVRQIVFNARFGVGMEASAYYAANRLPETLSMLLMGGALTNAMIPVLLSAARDQGQQAVQRLANLILTTMLVAIVPIIIVCLLLTPLFVTTLLAPGFDTPTSNLTIVLTRMMLLELVLMMAVSVANALLMSRNQFLLPAIGVSLHNLTIILGIVLAMVVPSIGIYGPTFGMITDSVLQLVIVIPGLLLQGIRFQPVWDPRDAYLRDMLRMLLPNGMAALVNYAGDVVDTSFATLSRTVGGLPAVHNAWLLTGLPIRLIGAAIGQAAFPRLAACAATHDWGTMRRLLLRTLGIALVLAVGASLALVVFGRWTIQTLFEHGQFDAAAGALTYRILVAYAPVFPAAIATEILTRSVIALHDTRTPLVINFFQLIGRMLLVPLLVPTFDVVAIPIAFTITATLEALVFAGVMYVKVRRRMC